MCIVIIPKVGATVSIVCLTFVDKNTLKSPERCAKISNILILALSIYDIPISTVTHFLMTQIVHQNLVYGYSGNQGTCTEEGLLRVFLMRLVLTTKADLQLHISSRSGMDGTKRTSEGIIFLYFHSYFHWYITHHLYNSIKFLQILGILELVGCRFYTCIRCKGFRCQMYTLTFSSNSVGKHC